MRLYRYLYGSRCTVLTDIHTDNSFAVPSRLGLALTLRILIPFACGYFLSYCYRSVNAVIAPDLTATLGLDAGGLGLLTSVYFLTFSLCQIPVGMMLDRFGPRRVESALLLVAASGAVVFALSENLLGLTLGRAMIGLGVSACLMASFKATSSWFPASSVPTMNGWIMAAGGLGALTATRPVELALQFTDWRGVVLAFAIATFAVAGLIFTTVPERSKPTRDSLADLLGGVIQVYKTPYFWRIVPFMVFTQAVFLAVQGLWAGPWLRDVAGLDRIEVANSLFYIAGAMVAGFLSIGAIASRLGRHGVPLAVVLGTCLFIFMLVQLGLTLAWVEFALPLWMLFGYFGSSGILTFPLLARHFPDGLTGRVNTCANVMVFMTAFAAQWLIGTIIDLWPHLDGYDPRGFQTAFALMLGVQTVAFIWFLMGGRSSDTKK